MKRGLYIFFFLTGIFISTQSYAEPQEYPSTLEEALMEIESLPWDYETINYTLPESHSTLLLPEKYLLARGDVARRFMFLNQGFPWPDTEAVLFDPETANQLIFSYHKIGHINLDSWDELDADHLLQKTIQLTMEGNVNRRKNNLPEAKVLDWIQKPTLDRERKSIYWTIELVEGKTRMANSIVLKLGRDGFERIIWVAPSTTYENSKGFLKTVIHNFEFKPNFRYADYKSGSSTKNWGVAQLLNTMISGGN